MKAKAIVREFLNLKLSGRTARLPFWCVMITVGAVNLGLARGLEGINRTGIAPEAALAACVLALAAAAVLTWLLIAVSARRFHDFGRSAWCVPLLFIPIVSILALIWAGCSRGDSGENAWGAPPA